MQTRKCPRCGKADSVKLEQEIEVIPLMPGEAGGQKQRFSCARCSNLFYEPSPECPKCGKDDKVEFKAMHQLGRAEPNVANIWFCNRCRVQFEEKPG